MKNIMRFLFEYYGFLPDLFIAKEENVNTF